MTSIHRAPRLASDRSFGREARGEPHVHRRRVAHLRRRDADDFGWETVERDRLPDDPRDRRRIGGATVRRSESRRAAHPASSSPGTNARPSAARTPSSWNMFALTRACVNRSAVPLPVRLTVLSSDAASAENAVDCRRQSLKSAGETEVMPPSTREKTLIRSIGLARTGARGAARRERRRRSRCSRRCRVRA